MIGQVQLEVPDGQAIAIRKPGIRWSLLRSGQQRDEREQITELVLLLWAVIVEPGD